MSLLLVFPIRVSLLLVIPYKVSMCHCIVFAARKSYDRAMGWVDGERKHYVVYNIHTNVHENSQYSLA